MIKKVSELMSEPNNSISSAIIMDNCTQDEFIFWKNFFDNFPTHLVSELSQDTFNVKYINNPQQLVTDYENVLKGDIKEVFKKEEYFNKFCKKMNSIVPNATDAQHFLMYVLSSDVHGWELECVQSDSHCILKPEENVNAYTRQTIVVQLSLLNALIEQGMMKTIYPQLSFLHTHILQGEIVLYASEDSQTNIKNNKQNEAMITIGSKETVYDQFVYSHTGNYYQKNKNYITNYADKQKEVYDLLRYLSMNANIDNNYKTNKKNKL